MEKKTGIVILVIGVLIVALVALAFGLEGGVKQLGADDVLRINNEVYKKAEFEEFIKYTLYKNDGEMKYDEETYAQDIANGTSKEDIFISDTLNAFYGMKVYGILANREKITLSEEDVKDVENDYTSDEEKILSAGLTKEGFMNIAKQQKIIEKISNSPKEYLELPDEVFEEYVNSFSGDDTKSYSYRMLQVAYEKESVSGDASGDISGDASGEVIPGNRDEKEAYINAIVARIESGESFEKAAESGDNRLVMKGNGLEFAKSMLEHSAGMLLSQKLGGSEDLAKALKEAKPGELTEVIDTGDVFQVAKLESVEEGIVGEAKDELVELMISQYASDLIYQVVKDMEVNNSAVSRIEIK